MRVMLYNLAGTDAGCSPAPWLSCFGLAPVTSNQTSDPGKQENRPPSGKAQVEGLVFSGDPWQGPGWDRPQSPGSRQGALHWFLQEG